MVADPIFFGAIFLYFAFGKLSAGINTPFSISSVRKVVFLASILAFFAVSASDKMKKNAGQKM